jgi:hypothetical protein
VSSVINGASLGGVDGAHTGDAGIQGDEQVEAFLLTDLADDEPLGSHPQRLADQVPQVISPVPWGGRAIPVGDVTVLVSERLGWGSDGGLSGRLEVVGGCLGARGSVIVWRHGAAARTHLATCP